MVYPGRQKKTTKYFVCHGVFTFFVDNTGRGVWSQGAVIQLFLRVRGTCHKAVTLWRPRCPFFDSAIASVTINNTTTHKKSRQQHTAPTTATTTTATATSANAAVCRWSWPPRVPRTTWMASIALQKTSNFLFQENHATDVDRA